MVSHGSETRPRQVSEYNVDRPAENIGSGHDQNRLLGARETAILIVTPQLAFRSGNLAAGELMRPGGPLVLRDGLLDVADPRHAMTLRNLALHASDRGHRVAVQCRCDPEEASWVASSRRLGGHNSDGMILIGLRRLSRAEPMLGREAMDMFGLTPAEARLAVQLAAGHGLAEIAMMNGVNISTLRAQLRAVYAKTGTAKQAELVSQIWRAASI